MKIIHSDLKKGVVKVKIEQTDDLWYLSSLIEQGDHVKASTVRKIKLGESTDRKVKIIKKTVFLRIEVKKVEFQAGSNVLRLSGIILDGPEDITRGSHHTITLEEQSEATIQKQWMQFQLQKLKEACETKKPDVLIVVHDREEACFALLQRFGYKLLSKISGNVTKKAEVSQQTTNFYKEIIKTLTDYDTRYKPNHIVVASPSFWKEDLLKNLEDDQLRKKMVLATCSTADETAINEVLKRQEIKQVMKEEKIAQEIKLVEDLLSEIAKENLATYGWKHVEERVHAGAVEKLMVSDEFLQKAKDAGKYDDINKIMKLVDTMKGSIHIIGSDHEGGKKLDGLGGIAAIVRYKQY